MSTGSPRLDGVLVCEDGSMLRGSLFGAQVPGRQPPVANALAYGELVFNTGMTGYQEALTDPSYAGQVLMMTYPLIGNYGVQDPAKYSESHRIWPEAFVVREWCENPSHPASERSIDQFLKDEGIVGLAGIDTREMTINVRSHGTLRCAIARWEDEATAKALVEVLKTTPSPDVENLVDVVSVKESVTYPGPRGARRIALVDTGVKMNIIRELQRNFEVVRVPWNTSYDEIAALAPAGIFLANGPGDPAHPELQEHIAPLIRKLTAEYPTMGICLGHQLLALAHGFGTFKLKFGHRGANQPVRHTDGTVEITSQNHGYAVSGEVPADGDLEVSVINLNDNTVEGLISKKRPLFSVQYHPEASPGPRDASYLFDKFRELIT